MKTQAKSTKSRLNIVTVITLLLAGGVAGTAYWYLNPKTYTSVAVIRSTDAADKYRYQTPENIAAALQNETVYHSCTKIENYQEIPAVAPFKISYSAAAGIFSKQDFLITPNTTGYTVTATTYGVEQTKQVTENTPFIFGNVTYTLEPTTTKNTAATTYHYTLYTPKALAQDLYQSNNINVVQEAGALRLTVATADPNLSKQILTQIVTETAVNTVSGEENLATLENSIAAVNESLKTTESEISNYKRKKGITDINNDLQAEQEYGNNLKSQKAELEMQMVALGNLHTYIRKNINGNYSGVEYDVITDPSFTEAIKRINDRYIQRSAAGLEQAASDGELMTMKENVSERILNTRRKVAIKIDQINAQMEMHEARLAKYPEYAGHLDQMQRQLAMDKSVYDLLIQKRAQAIVNQNNAIKETILQPATFAPYADNHIPYTTTGTGMAIGALLGLMLAYRRRSQREQIITTRKEAESTIGDIRFLGTIGTIRSKMPAEDPSFSNLSTRFLMSGDTKMVTITSSQSGEGKTFIATNFAKSLASLDKKVLLVDMNTYHPEIANLFDVQHDTTLADALETNCDIHDAIAITNIPNLDVLTAGTLTGGVNALLVSKQTQKIFEKLRSHYDAIIIDTPEASKHIDALPLMKMSDMSFYVVRSNGTTKTQLENVATIKTDFGINNLFLVLNTAEKGVNHSGVKVEPKYRQMRAVNSSKNNSQFPEVLRKIALWFY